MPRLTQTEPADFADVRATNLAVTLRFVRANAPCSRADIAAATGLNKATVSSLVADLLERRLVREVGLTENRIGRPATMIVIDGDPYVAIGLEVNGDYLAAVATTMAGTELLSWRRSFHGVGLPADQAITAITSLARNVVHTIAEDGRQVLGITVGIPGLVDGHGTVRLAPNLGWHDVDLASELASALGGPGFPITVNNDANLAATAEYYHGAHAGTKNLIYMTGEVGIGAGVIADGQLLRGGGGFAGEIGHIQLDPDGPPCACGGRGHVESLASMAAILRRVSTFNPEPNGSWRPEIDDIVRRAHEGDDTVRYVLTDVGTWLGRGAAILANVVNPDVVILGGYFVPLSAWLLPPAQAALTEHTLAPGPGPTLVPSTLNLRATAIGGTARLLEAVYAGDLPTPATR